MIDPVAFQIGPFAVRWYAICIVSGLILAVYLAMKEAPKRKILSDDILDFILVAFPVAIVGARLYYVPFRLGLITVRIQVKSSPFLEWRGLAIYGGFDSGRYRPLHLCR